MDNLYNSRSQQENGGDRKKSFDKRNYFPNFVFTSYTVTVMKKLSTAAIFLIQFDNKAKLSSL